jgi:hypothetical protein
MPTVKNHRARQGANIIAKGLASGQRLAQQRLFVIAPLQDGMEKKRQPIEAEQQRCQVLLAMTKVMLNMRACGFEHVLVFVRNLPAPAACLGALQDVCGPQAMIGDQAVVIELLTCFGMDRGHLEPMDAQGPFATLQKDLVKIAIPRDGGATATPAACCQRLDGLIGLPKGQALLERGRGIGRAHNDAVHALVSGELTQGVVTGESIAPQGDTVRRHRRGVFVKPPFARHLCAVLCVMTVLRHDACRGQGDHLGAPWAHAHRGNGALRIAGVAMGALTPETGVAMHRLGGMVLGTIECDQPLVRKDPPVGQ